MQKQISPDFNIKLFLFTAPVLNFHGLPSFTLLKGETERTSRQTECTKRAPNRAHLTRRNGAPNAPKRAHVTRAKPSARKTRQTERTWHAETSAPHTPNPTVNTQQMMFFSVQTAMYGSIKYLSKLGRLL